MESIVRKDKANKKATDLGVLGLEATKAALEARSPSVAKQANKTEPKDEGGFTASNWGKETVEEKERKAKFARDARARQSDRFVMAKAIAANLIRAYIVQKVFRGSFSTILGEARAKYTIWTILGMVAWYKWGAWTPLNSQLEAPVARYPFIGSMLAMVLNKSRYHNFFLESLKKINFQTSEITIPNAGYIAMMDARDREYVLKTNFRNYLKNREGDLASFEYVFGELMGRGIFATDKIEWQDSRKIASHMFSGASLKAKMESVFNEHADKVVHLLETRICGTGKAIDMQDVFQSAIFDAFCEIAFGYYPHAIDSAIEGKKPEFLVAFDTCQSIATERVLLPPFVWHLQRVISSFTGFGEEAEFARSAKILDAYVLPIIEERMKDEGLSEKNDLLSLYIKHGRDTKQSHMLETSYLRDTIINFMIAGRDTTSCTLAYTVRYIGENPDAEKRLLEEAVMPLARKGSHVTWDDSRTVPYADATFNEVLRMAPPVGDDLRICVGDDVWPSGVKVRDGTRVIIPNVAIGRDPFLWQNPDTFDPDRWMNYDDAGVPQQVKRMDEYVYPVFFSGRRLCLGKDMARFESIVFMTKLFSKLRFKPLPVTDDTYATGPVIFLRGGNPCLVEKRDTF